MTSWVVLMSLSFQPRAVAATVLVATLQIIGKAIPLSGNSYAIVGVMPGKLCFPTR